MRIALTLATLVVSVAGCQCGGTPPVNSGQVSISTTSLAGASVGVAYTAAVTATGGEEPYQFAVTAGGLPPGLSLASSGEVSGTPTSVGSFSFTVSVTDAASGTASQALSIDVAEGALVIMTTSLPNGQVGSVYQADLIALGGTPPYAWNVAMGALPAGLSLSSSGAISGTPSVAGTSSFVVMVTDSAAAPASQTTSLAITINSSSSSASPLRIVTSSLQAGTVGAAYSAQLTASGGTTPISWAIGAGTSLPPGLTLSSGGLLSGTPTIAGSYDFAVVAVDSSSPQQSASAALSLTIAATSGNLVVKTENLPNGTVGAAYSQQLEATGGTGPYSWTIATGTVPTGLTLAAGGVLSGTPTTAGSFTFTVQVTDSSASPLVSQATFTVTINANPSQGVAITTGALPPGTVGSAYQAQLNAAGGTTPYTWAVVNGDLPNGLALSAAGAISGTPTAAGSFTFTVEVADSSNPEQTATKQFSITVATTPGQTLSITTATLPNGTVGTPYSATVTASGGNSPYTFSVASGTLPPGVTIDAAGVLSGTPTTAGSFNVTIRVTDSSSTPLIAERSYTVTIAAAVGQLTITTMNLPQGRVGVAYGATLNAANGTAPYHWTVSAGALPSGLSLSDGGNISGSPTTAGTYTFTVKVTDSASTPKSASKQFSITIR